MSVEPWSGRAGALRMAGLACGAADAPPVVLLHGFPELSESWREVLPALAEAGLRAIAPDLRGYGGTDRPRGGYDLDSLARDVADLVATLPGGRAHLAGHDWGGVIAYHVAARHPERVRRLAVVNAPHPADFARKLWRPAQLARSWYVFAFQTPWLPERLLSARGGALVPRLMRASASDKSRFTDERLAPYARAFSTREAAASALAYYRRAVRGAAKPSYVRELRDYPRIRAPFRLVWGERDVALGLHLTRGLERWFESAVEVRRLPDVGHFVPLEAPATLARLLVEHFARDRG